MNKLEKEILYLANNHFKESKKILVRGKRFLVLTNDGKIHFGVISDYSSLNYYTYDYTNFVDISLGDSHLLAICKNGYIHGAGINHNGVLGIGNITNIHNIKKLITAYKFVKAKAGKNHSVFLREDGYVFTCGDNKYGQLGDGSKTNKDLLVSIKSSYKFVDISTFNNHTLLINEDGYLYGFGHNKYYQMGDVFKETIVREPTRLILNEKFKKIYAGEYHSIAIDLNDYVWICGRNYYFKNLICGYEYITKWTKLKLKSYEVNINCYNEIIKK